MSYSIFLDKQMWSCDIHSGCLYSIPCDCSNCQLYSNYLEMREDHKHLVQEQLQKHPGLQVKNGLF